MAKDSKDVQIGNPYVSGAKVEVEIIEQKQTTTYGMGNLDHGLRQVQPSDGIKSINRILILPHGIFYLSCSRHFKR